MHAATESFERAANDPTLTRGYTQVPPADGYVPPVLTNVWARAPYGHAGQWPSLAVLATAPDEAPARFVVDSTRRTTSRPSASPHAPPAARCGGIPPRRDAARVLRRAATRSSPISAPMPRGDRIPEDALRSRRQADADEDRFVVRAARSAADSRCRLAMPSSRSRAAIASGSQISEHTSLTGSSAASAHRSGASASSRRPSALVVERRSPMSMIVGGSLCVSDAATKHDHHHQRLVHDRPSSTLRTTDQRAQVPVWAPRPLTRCRFRSRSP